MNENGRRFEIKPLSKSNARAVGLILAAGILIASRLDYAPYINFIKQLSLSTNIEDYSIKITHGDDVCYSNKYPVLSDAYQKVTIFDAFCPNGINGDTKIVEITIPSLPSINAEKIK